MKSLLTGKDLDAGKDRGQKGETENEFVGGIIHTMDLSLSKLWEIVKERETQGAAVYESKSQTRLSD